MGRLEDMGIKMNTKRILANSFCELLEQKSIEEISVQNIIQNCGASRTTFYNHFLDKYDLMLWIYKEDMQEIWSIMGENWKEKCSRILDYFTEKRSYYLNVSQHNGQNSIQKEMLQRLIDNAYLYLGKKYHVSKFEEEVEYAIYIYSKNVVEDIFQWIKTPNPCSKEQLLKNMSAYMPVILEHYFYGIDMDFEEIQEAV